MLARSTVEEKPAKRIRNQKIFFKSALLCKNGHELYGSPKKQKRMHGKMNEKRARVNPREQEWARVDQRESQSESERAGVSQRESQSESERVRESKSEPEWTRERARVIQREQECV